MRSIAFVPDCPLPADGIIPAQMVNDLISLERAAKRARRRLHLRIERIRKAIENEKVTARQQGYADGLKVFESAMEELRREYREHYEQTGALVRKYLEQILLRVPSEDWLDAMITSALKSVRDEPELSIMVHPDNLAALENTIVKRRNEYPGLSNLKVEPNNMLTLQDCLVYAGPNVIDMSIPIILDELFHSLSAGETI